MEYSRYNIYHKVGEYYIIFNSKNSKIMVLKDQLAANIASLDRTGNLYNMLLKEGFIVENQNRETQEVALNRHSYIDSQKDYKRYTIFPTLRCNAHCSFCYENDNDRYDMDEETVRNTIDFIKKDIKGFKKLRIYWFGGEPMVRADIIDTISKALIDYCKENGISYKSSIATNLSLIDEKNVRYIIDNWNLDKIEFAFDGMREQHNVTKNYCNTNFDAFNHNFRMIDVLLGQGLTVQIRFNIDKVNYREMLVVIENILKKHPGNKKLIPYLGVIFKTPNNTVLENENLISLVEYGDYAIPFMDLLKKYGLLNGIEDLPLKSKTNNCYASNPNSIVIGAKGILTKCQMCPDDLLNNIGIVGTGLQQNEVFSKWCKTDYLDECFNCSFYPLCLTGCIGQKLIYNGEACCKEKYYMTQLLDYAISLINQEGKLEPNKIYSLQRVKQNEVGN